MVNIEPGVTPDVCAYNNIAILSVKSNDCSEIVVCIWYAVGLPTFPYNALTSSDGVDVAIGINVLALYLYNINL